MSNIHNQKMELIKINVTIDMILTALEMADDNELKERLKDLLDERE